MTTSKPAIDLVAPEIVQKFGKKVLSNFDFSILNIQHGKY